MHNDDIEKLKREIEKRDAVHEVRMRKLREKLARMIEREKAREERDSDYANSTDHEATAKKWGVRVKHIKERGEWLRRIQQLRAEHAADDT